MATCASYFLKPNEGPHPLAGSFAHAALIHQALTCNPKLQVLTSQNARLRVTDYGNNMLTLSYCGTNHIPICFPGNNVISCHPKELLIQRFMKWDGMSGSITP